MTLTLLQPTAALRPYVKQFTVVETDGEFTSTLTPGTSLVLGCRFSGSGKMEEHGRTVSLPNFTVAGLRDSVRTMTHSKGGILLTVLTETGASAFFREPLNELFNATIPFDCLIDHKVIRPLEDGLPEAHDHAHRVQIMEDFLLGQVRDLDPDPDVLLALEAVRKANGNARIEEIARRVGLSHSALERKFRKSVGSSPKKFSSLVRLRRVLDLHAKGGRLGDIAQEAGYFDQAHFAKDFKAFTGQSPETFFRSSTFW